MKLQHLLLFFLFAGVYSQSENNATSTVTNSTSTATKVVTYVPDCSLRNPTCNDRGVCMSDGSCRCWYGFFGYSMVPGLSWSFGSSIDNCYLSTSQLSPYNVQLKQLRIFQGIIFGFITLLMAYRLVLEFWLTSAKGSGAVITKYSMILLFILCLWQTVQCGDFFGNFGNLSPKGYYVLYYFKDNLLLFVFSALLFHWAELYHEAIRKMKREEMLKKIKPDYEPHLTVEDILLKMSYVSKFRFAYVFVCGLSFLVYVGIEVIELTSRSQSAWKAYIVFYFSFYTAVWILFSIGYVYYGIHLLSIIPAVMQGRIKAVMALTGLFSLFGVANAVLNIIIQAEPGKNTINIKTLYALYALVWMMAFFSLNIFMPIWEWHLWFNPKVIRSMRRTSHSHTPNSPDSEAPNSPDMQLEVLPREGSNF
ncbi:hypothetical protein PROFUN_09145 [Planoprotostelium fungivorum]|uniref:Uncharacterized protein n=1 Tax=Planoprotostelium fungivorum TaxID=1890364 RepID=A0A2P6MVH8_9EUKA|nr:hypothetical protein PROFUN_09145 [Planoprotostelium fungivorum]